MDIQTLWNLVEPYLMWILSFVEGALITYALVRSYTGKFTSKFMGVFSKKYDTDIMAEKVADRLAGKTIDIDVTALTEKKLAKIGKALDDRINEVRKTVESYKLLLVLIASAVSKFKALTSEEREKLAETIRTVEKDYALSEPEPVATVRLLPIALEDKTEPEEDSLINLGGPKE